MCKEYPLNILEAGDPDLIENERKFCPLLDSIIKARADAHHQTD